MKNLFIILLTLLVGVAGDVGAAEPKPVTVSVIRYTFLREETNLGNTSFYFKVEHGSLRADGKFDRNYEDKERPLPKNKDSENKRKFSGKWLAVDYDMEKEERQAAFKQSPAYRPEGFTFAYVQVEPRGSGRPSAERLAADITAEAGIAGIAELTGEALKQRLPDKVAAKAGYLLEAPAVVEGAAALGFAIRGARSLAFGQKLVEEAERLRDLGRQYRAPADTTEHLGLYLQATGLATMAAIAPGGDEVRAHARSQMARLPAPAKDTVLFTGKTLWVWDGKDWSATTPKQ